MDESLVRNRVLALGLLCAVVVVLWLPLLPISQGGAHDSNTGEITVAFLDVGQGDGIFIKTPDGVQVLIDGGPDAKVLRSLAYNSQHLGIT